MLRTKAAMAAVVAKAKASRPNENTADVGPQSQDNHRAFDDAMGKSHEYTGYEKN